MVSLRRLFESWPRENLRLRLTFLGLGFLALVTGELFAAWLGVPAGPVSEASFNIRSLVVGLFVIPLAGSSLVVYARWVSERAAVILTGLGVVGVIVWGYVGMLTTSSSTAGLGLIAVIFYPWPIVAGGWLLNDALRRRRGRHGSGATDR